MRITPLVVESFYHIYTRGVDKRNIFLHPYDYRRFTHTIHSLLLTGSATQRPSHNQGVALTEGFDKKIDILCYCLMPNHYHFLLYQKTANGISEFMHNLNTSYTMVFNKQNKRTGRLFESTFKANLITSDEQLIHVSRYIHLNPVLASLSSSPDEYPWSSFREYCEDIPKKICQTESILNQFPKKESYRSFVVEYIPEALEAKHAQDKNDIV